MPLPASASAWRAVRWLVKHSGEVIAPTALYLLDLTDDDNDVADLAWVRAVVRYQRATPAGTSEDYAQFKLDLLNITSGAVDTSWTSGDFTAVTTAITTFLNGLPSFMSPSHTAKEIRYYGMRFNESDPGPVPGDPKAQRPFAQSGPPIAIATLSIPGTASGTFWPYQVAMSVTFRTPWPKHWGRIYLPGIIASLTSSGRWGSATQTIANLAFDLQDDLAAAGFLLTVPVAQVEKQRLHALLPVSQVVVDDIPDVIRRRRPKQAAVRSIGVE